jgi:hypothetical protein
MDIRVHGCPLENMGQQLDTANLEKVSAPAKAKAFTQAQVTQ